MQEFYTVTQFDVGRSFVTWGTVPGRFEEVPKVWESPIGTIHAKDVGLRFFRCPTADILEAEERETYKARIDAETRVICKHCGKSRTAHGGFARCGGGETQFEQ